MVFPTINRLVASFAWKYVSDFYFIDYFQPKSTGEHKTKPTQSSVRELRSLGLSPDIIVCRSETPISQEVKEKISNFCHVKPEHVSTS